MQRKVADVLPPPFSGRIGATRSRPQVPLTALAMLVYMGEKAETEENAGDRGALLGNTDYINNWDLVDVSADKILGPYLYDKDRACCELAQSGCLWQERISVIATFISLNKEILPIH